MAKMWNICVIAFILVLSKVQSQCLDINGRTIAEDVHYVPGPDACTLCVCEKGLPSICKAVLCSPPTECQSFSRVGKSCCNFTCLDDAYHKKEEFGTDMGLRLLVSAVAALISLSLLFFLIHRLRQRKSIGRQSRTLRTERRSLGGMGYLAGGIGYLPENFYPGADGFDRHIEFHYEEAPSHMSLWKPPGGSYMPRGEAPPPYDEVVAHTRPELIITASRTLPNISHRTIPLSLTAPGTIRIIHPQQRRACPESGAVTLPRTPGKLPDAPGSTLHINITGCGFHAVQSLDEAAQVPTPPEFAKDADIIGSYETAQVSQIEHAPPTNVQSQQNPRAGPSHGACALSPVADEGDDDAGDDYRAECENCKSSPTVCSRYYGEEEPALPETMTLQRMPRDTDGDADEESYYRSSVTLPIKCKQPRRVLGGRDGWFTSMPEWSSEEE